MSHVYGPDLHPVTFLAGNLGEWKIERVAAVTGAGLPLGERLAVRTGTDLGLLSTPQWALRGVASHARYVQRAAARRTPRDLRVALAPHRGQPGVSAADRTTPLPRA